MNLFIDIEALPTTNEIIRQRIAANIGPPANYKKPETIAAWMADNFDTEFKMAVQKTALDGTWGHIACIGWAIDDGPVFCTIGTSEKELIETWAANLRDYILSLEGANPAWWARIEFVGHNVQDFDLRFLWQRSRVLGVKLGLALPLDRYPRNVYDTMKEWSGFGKYVKQADLEIALGIERTDEITGAEVAVSTPAQITAHCMEDVRCVREIYRRMTA